MKPGWKSTEFWLSVVAQVVGFVLVSGLVGNDRAVQALGLAASVLSSLGYTAGRSYAKAWASPSRESFVSVPSV